MKGMRRIRRCHKKQRPLPKKQHNIFFSKVFFAVVFSFLFATPSFAQLTYATLFVQYDSPWVCNNLKLIPVKFRDTAIAKRSVQNTNIISFEQALKEGKVTVREMTTPGGADVGMLELKNHSKKNILIESGEMVAGGKQDRAFAETTIIPPDDNENFVPVFCVEKGRWENRLRNFRYAGPANASLRKQMNIAKKQNKVWKEIDRQLADDKKINTTGAYINLYRDTSGADSACLTFFRKKMKDSDSLYAGFVALTGDHIINCELFGSSDLCITSFETMLKGHMRSVRDKAGTVSISDDEVKKFLDKFLKTEEQQQKYLADHGAIFTYDKKVIHLIAYSD
jgi:hypothetical protein